MPTSDQLQRVLVLLASPRKRGNCALLSDRLAAGVADAGGDPHVIFLSTLKIAPCNACDRCLNTGHGCVIEDDMQTIYEELALASAVVFATPVYWFNYTAQLKLVIDRTYGIQRNATYALTGKKVAILMTYEDVDVFSSGGVNVLRSLQDMCRFVRADIVGTVHGSAAKAGDIGKRPLVLQQAYDLGQKLVHSLTE
jgi:multimeric flavodoxin WrbA